MNIVSFRKQINLLDRQETQMNRSLAIGLLVTSAVSGLASSCKDENKPPTPTYCQQSGTCETVMEAKQYFAFKIGSWWVYEEESTHERDSVYVIEYTNDDESPNFDVTSFSERENMRYHYFPLIVTVNGCGYFDQISEKKCIYVKRSKWNFGMDIWENTCFFIQHRKGSSTSSSNIDYFGNKIYIADIFTTYELSGLSFNKTIKVFEEHTASENNEPTNHFYSKNVGLVRKELLNSNQVWNLVAYHIEP